MISPKNSQNLISHRVRASFVDVKLKMSYQNETISSKKTEAQSTEFLIGFFSLE